MGIFDFLISHEVKPKAKDRRSRLTMYAEYLESRNLDWFAPDLNVYRVYLENEKNYSPSTVMSHLSTIRNWYKEFMNKLKSENKSIHTQLLEQSYDFESESLDAITKQLTKAAEYKTTRPDLDDEPDFWYPSHGYLDALFSIDLRTLQDLRDLVIIGFAYCAGLTEMEIVALKREHIEFDENNQIVLHVPEVQATNVRQIKPYDNLLFESPWLTDATSLWLQCSTSKEDLFVSFFRGGNTPRNNSLSLRGLKTVIQQQTSRAQATVDEIQSLTILDLRRTAARQLNKRDVSVKDIKYFLGFNTLEAVLKYIGPPNLSADQDHMIFLSTEKIFGELNNLKWILRQSQ